MNKESWDREFSEKYIQFCKNVDILIHDSQYLPEEVDARKGWGHSDYQSALDLAEKAGVKKLILFHHDPIRTDSEIERIEKTCQEITKEKRSDLIVEAARETKELEF